MIRKDSIQCDICGKIISGLDPKEQVNKFEIAELAVQLVCHNDCRDLLARADGKFERLPDGPLRRILGDIPYRSEKETGNESQDCAWCLRRMRAGHYNLPTLWGMCKTCFDGEEILPAGRECGTSSEESQTGPAKLSDFGDNRR